MRYLIEHVQITIGTEWYDIKRSRVLTDQLERAFGPLLPFAKRLSIGEITVEQLTLLWRVLLQHKSDDDPPSPTIADLQKHAWKRGVLGHEDLSVFVSALVLGDERLELAATALAAQKRA